MKPSASISVVIPAYNASAFVADALNSIKDQELLPHEVFVVDDGSKDDTAAVVRSWISANPTPFQVQLLQQSNGGISVARNTAMQRSVCRWVALLDADDIWLPAHLKALQAAAEAAPQAIVAYSGGRLFRGQEIQELPYDDFWDNPSKQFGKKIEGSDALLVGRDALTRLLRGNFIKPSSLMLLRSALDQWGLFDEKQGNAEDRELLARFLIHGEFVYNPEPSVLYRWHNDNASQGKNAKRNMEFGLLAVRSISQRFADKLSPEEKQSVSKILKVAAGDYADVCARDGLRTLARGADFLRVRFGTTTCLSILKPKRILRGLISSIEHVLKKNQPSK